MELRAQQIVLIEFTHKQNSSKILSDKTMGKHTLN